MAYFEYQPNSTIFYYTNDIGFHGIVSSKQLWLSDIATLNDPREINLGMKLLTNAIDAYEDDTIFGVSNHDLQKLLLELQNFRQQSTLYACCFCSKGDELPMWRSYADNGVGISIGIRPTALSAIPGRVQLVRYVEDNIRQHFQQVVLSIAHTLGESKTIERVFSLSAALAAVTCIKHRSWDYEKEIRVIYNQRHVRPSDGLDFTKYTSAYDDGEFVEWSEPLQREGKNGPVRYFPFAFGRRRQGKIDYKRAIESVIIGRNSQLKRQDVVDLLHSNGFEDFKVKQSDCEFR